MHRNQGKISASNIATVLLVIINAIVLEKGLVSDPAYYRLLLATIPLLLVSILFTKKASR